MMIIIQDQRKRIFKSLLLLPPLLLAVVVCYHCSLSSGGGGGGGGRSSSSSSRNSCGQGEDCNVVVNRGVSAAAAVLFSQVDAAEINPVSSMSGPYRSSSNHIIEQYDSNHSYDDDHRDDDDQSVPRPQRRSQTTRPRNMICVGGSSGMGKAAALECLMHGGNVLLVSRSTTKLDKAKDQLVRTMTKISKRQDHHDDHDANDGDDEANRKYKENDTAQWENYFSTKIQTASLDVTDETAVRHFADELMTTAKEFRWDVLVISVADKAPHGPMLTLPTSDTRYMMETKVWSAYHCAKYLAPVLLHLRNDMDKERINNHQNDDNHIDERGSQSPGSSSPPSTSPPVIMQTPAVIFVAGILNRRPGKNCVPLAMANGALEGLTRSLALEWGPNIRVNCMSPGFCDTERFDHMPSTTKQAMMDNTAASLPLQRVGRPEDMGQALWYLATAEFCTGTVLDVDGGHGIRQYASATNDPMRKRTEDK